jgi:hypothetical protein
MDIDGWLFQAVPDEASQGGDQREEQGETSQTGTQWGWTTLTQTLAAVEKNLDKVLTNAPMDSVPSMNIEIPAIRKSD